MAKIVINTDSISHVYAGQTILSGSSYTIQGIEHLKFANDDNLLSDIALGKAKINDGTNDIIGVSAQINFLKDIDFYIRDTDSIPLQRMKITTTGWHLHYHGITFNTSSLDTVYDKDVSGNDYGYITKKIYNSNNEEITTPGVLNANLNTCVKTVVDFEPTYDYDIVGGSFYMNSIPGTDIYCWAIGVPDISEEYGGSKVFASSVNLKHIGGRLVVDGKTPKFLEYNATYHTNKIRFIFKHNAGIQADIHIVLNLFKA